MSSIPSLSVPSAHPTDHPEVKPVFRSEVVKAMESPRITKPYFTKYEYTVLLASRQQQIAEGAKPLVSLDGLRTSDPQFLDQVVKREIEQRKLPYVFQRLMPNGTAEFWSAQELELSW